MKIRITQTLLSNWEYMYKLDDGKEAFENCLNRIKTEQTKAMLEGIRFEGVLNSVLDGNTIDDTHEWYSVIKPLSEQLKNSQKQVTLFKEIEVDGEKILLHGVLDFLKKGIIYDTKYSKTYTSHIKYSKYQTSPQTAMYLELVPEAYKMQYIISDGKNIFRETYRRGDFEPIESVIHHFLVFCKQYGYYGTLKEKWGVADE